MGWLESGITIVSNFSLCEMKCCSLFAFNTVQYVFINMEIKLLPKSWIVQIDCILKIIKRRRGGEVDEERKKISSIRNHKVKEQHSFCLWKEEKKNII